MNRLLYWSCRLITSEGGEEEKKKKKKEEKKEKIVLMMMTKTLIAEFLYMKQMGLLATL